jgi:hypothetical protein
MIVELELLSPVTAADSRWFGADDLAQIDLAHPDQRRWIETFLAEQTSGAVPAQRAPWARPGWYAAMRTWAAGQLQQLGYGDLERVEIVRTWGISCVLRLQTGTGQQVYFKANLALPLFVNEAVVTAALAGYFPDRVPRPLAIAAEAQWMLLAPLDGEIDYEATLPHRQRLTSAFAALQATSTRHVDDLLAHGCLDRRLDWMIEQIDPLLATSEFFALTGEELARLRQLVPILKERCRQLAEYRVPPALIHGDLHCGNVAFRGDGLTIFDWTDACITHPFFDMFTIYLEKDVEVKAALRDRYLTAWTAFEPLDRLQQLWALAEPIFALHHTISYWTIVSHIEPDERADLAWGVPRFARLILQSLPEEV